MASIAFALLLLCVLAIPASAHPGGTDENGGHYDRSTGEYHYHHGFQAHSHWDMDGDGILDCPYDFVDKTGSSSGGDSFSDDYSPPEIVPIPTKSTEKQKVAAKENTEEAEGNVVELWKVCIMLLAAGIVIWAMYRALRGKEYEILQQARGHKEEMQREHNYVSKNLKELDADIAKEFGEEYLYSVCGAPEGDYLGSDNLPATGSKGSDKWGEKYTFYLHSYPVGPNKRNTKYHRRTCRYASTFCPINAYDCRGLEPCYICMPSLPNMEWVDQYMKHRIFLEEYNVTAHQGGQEDNQT